MRSPLSRLFLVALMLGGAAPALAGPRPRDDDDDDRPRRPAAHHPPPAAKPTARPVRERNDDDEVRPAPALGSPTPPPPPATSAKADDDDDVRPPVGGAPVAARDADDDDDERGPAPTRAIVITGRRLDEASQRFDRALGASVYTLAGSAIEGRPGGEFGAIGQVLRQFPGVAGGPAGRIAVRGVPGAAEVRINNAILPVDGNELLERLSSRLVGQANLVRGALPAAYGPGAAAVVALRPKTGHDLAGGQAELQLGTAGIFEPAIEWAGSSERSSLFVTANAFRSDLGQPAPEPVGHPDHDRTRQASLFAYGEQLLGADTRVALIAGADDDRFDIPNPRSLAGLGLDGRRRQADHFALLNLQHSAGAVQFQVAAARGWSVDDALPDPRLAGVTGGLVQQLHRRGHTSSLQLEAGWDATPRHHLRAGLLLRGQREDARADTLGLAANPLTNREVERGGSSGLFASDEWQPLTALSITAGLRVDRLRGGGTFWQPRLGASLDAGSGLTLHAGYARTVLPQLADLAGVALLAGRPITDPRPERDSNVEAGASWHRGGLTLDLSAYARRMHDAHDLALLTGRPDPVPFSFTRGQAHGLEAALTYAHGPWSAWANAALARGWGRGLASGAALFSPIEKQAIAAGRVALGTLRPWTLSGGLVRRIGRISLSGDVIHEAGLPGDGGGRIAARLAPLTRVDAAANLRLAGLGGRGLDVRLELANALDSHDPLEPGRGLVAQAGFQPGRTLALLLEQGF